jgi:uncharacterized pyridoxal phosphate-containing UPF0001 family protein
VADACVDLGGMAYLAVRGLMAIPPLEADPNRTRPYFRRLRELAQSLAQSDFANVRMDELSMGMSADYPIAVEEGATLIRVGTAIFGTRDV